ncbi:MAG: RlmE family RNA methyltransferase [Pseudomonadota bacterium]
MKKPKTSKDWLREHEADEFVLRARREGFRSRAVYKLTEIDEKHRLLVPGRVVVDLGAAPGGWSQVASAAVGSKGKVIAVDILPMDPIPGVEVVLGDFTRDETLAEVRHALGGRPADLVISDMAPNLSGMKDVDQPRATYLVELALDLADQVLVKGGAFVAKCFEGEGINGLRAGLKERFRRTYNVKPKASRGRSREIYLVGRDYIGQDSV